MCVRLFPTSMSRCVRLCILSHNVLYMFFAQKVFSYFICSRTQSNKHDCKLKEKSLVQLSTMIDITVHLICNSYHLFQSRRCQICVLLKKCFKANQRALPFHLVLLMKTLALNDHGVRPRPPSQHGLFDLIWYDNG